MAPLTTTYAGAGVAPTMGVTASFIAYQQFSVLFSEPMAPATILAGNFTLTANGGATVRTLTTASLSADGLTATFGTSGDLSSGAAAYTLGALPTVTDVAGNSIDPAADEADLTVPVLDTAVSVNQDGGEIISVATALADGEYTIVVGLVPSVSGELAFSARPGHAANCLVSAGVLTFTFPHVAPGGPYLLFATPVAGGPGVTLPPTYTARRRPIFSATIGLRRFLPATWNAGARTAEDEVVE